MNRLLPLLTLAFLLVACNEDGKITTTEVDSTLNKVENGIEKVVDSAGKHLGPVADSAKAEFKELKQELRERLKNRNRKDSLASDTLPK